MTKLSDTGYNILHGSFFLMNLIGLVWYCISISDFHYLIKYFSLHAFWLAIFYSISSLIKSLRHAKITQILYELGFTTNVIACSGYWIIVRPHIVNFIQRKFLKI